MEKNEGLLPVAEVSLALPENREELADEVAWFVAGFWGPGVENKPGANPACEGCPPSVFDC